MTKSTGFLISFGLVMALAAAAAAQTDGATTMEQRIQQAVEAATAAQTANASKMDPRVRQALDAQNLNYTELENGNYRLHYTLEGDRTHLVLVESVTSEFGGMEIRDVWGMAWKGSELPYGTARKLLEDNALKKIGGWEVHEEADGDIFLIFNAKIPADSDGAALASATEAVAAVADEWEQRLMGSDDY